MLLTFSLTVFAWIFFRAEDISHAISYLSGIFSTSIFVVPTIFPKQVILLILMFLSLEWLGRNNNYAIEKTLINSNKYVKFTFYYSLIIIIYFFGSFNQNIEFIYFQF